MKIAAYTTLFVLYFTQLSLAQSHKVVSATTQAGLPYAVVTSHSGKGIYTNEQGVFDAGVFPAGDSLTFYCVGYERVTRSAGQLPGTIALQPLSRTMNEVVISANTPVKTIPYPKRGMPFVWTSSVGMQLATRIPFLAEDSGKLKQLTEVRIRIKRLDEDNPCRLHVYAVTPADTPGEELLTKDILLTREDANHIAFQKDLSGEDIYVSATSVYVGIEWIGQTKKEELKPGAKYSAPPPFLRMTQSIPEQRTHMRFLGQPRWRPVKSHDGGNPPNMVVSLSYR